MSDTSPVQPDHEQSEPAEVIEPPLFDSDVPAPASGAADMEGEADEESDDGGGDGSAGSGDVLGASEPGQASTTVKDPSDWVTGDEAMTGAQRSYLDTLARAAGEQLPADLTKAEASEHIDRLQGKTGRGAS